MEKKQLNFSAPLMSTRRYSSPLRPSGEDNSRDSPRKEDRKTIHSKHLDLNMGEVVKPGSIPFIWEQTPGKAKGGSESQLQSPEELPSTPKLPPGRKSGELNGFRTPNKLSGELVVLKSRNKLSGELNVLRPQHKFSGELHTLRPHKFSGEINTLNKFSHLDSGMVRWDSSKEGTEKNASSESENDDDNTFSDALESFSMNCSISGLSGSEILDKKSSRIISADARARDFMMDRFLPAAKAMTLEPSQYASRKQNLAVVKPPNKETKALVPRPKTPPPSQNVCNIVPYTGQDIGSEESEEEEEEDRYNEKSIMSVKIKACGFLPWFCSKNSLRLLNPLPSIKDKSKSALSSASKVKSLVKSGSWKSPGRKLDERIPFSNNKHKVDPGFKSCELQIPKHTSRPMFYSGELQTRSTSPYSRRSSASPYRNESSHPIYQNGVGFLAAPKRDNPKNDNGSKISPKDSKGLKEKQKNSRLSGTRNPVVEKTSYKDTVNITKVSHSLLNISKTKKRVDDSSNELGGSVQEVAKHGGRLEIMKARGISGPLVHGDVGKKSKALEAPKVLGNGNTNTCRELVVVDDSSAMEAALTPPLPKSPSESWLSRNLSSVSPRNSVSYSTLNSKLLSRKQNAKWETIVKSSHLRHDHGRYSEELVTHVPQPPRAWK